MEVLQTYILDAISWSTPAVMMHPERLMITCDRSGKIYAFKYGSGKAIWERQLGKMITASPTLADINNDGIEEILISTEDSGVLFVLDYKGNILWSVKCGTNIRSSVAVADIDNDGCPEVIVAAYGNHIICLEGATGKKKWKKYLGKHEFSRATGIVSSPLIADVDLDGELEIVVGTRFQMGFCLSARDGRFKWVRSFPYDPDSSPSFAVIAGKPLVFLGGGEHTSGVGDNALYALNGNDGSVFWRTKVHGGLDSSPIVSDINNDGKAEVVITSLADASCYAFDALTGSILWRYQIQQTAVCEHDEFNVCRVAGVKKYFTGHAICRSYTTPLILDMGDNVSKHIVVGSNNGKWWVIAGDTGIPVEERQQDGMVRGSVISCDINNDGLAELLITAGNQMLVYKTPAIAEKNTNRMFKKNIQHTGNELPEHVEIIKKLESQSLTQVRYIWYWLIKDAIRFTMFHLEKKILGKVGIKLRKYYY